MLTAKRLMPVLFAAALCLPVAGWAQVSYTPMPLDKGFGELDPSQPALPVAQIMTKFEARESDCRRALAHYTYERAVKVETVDEDGKVDGQYSEVVDITADPNGKLYERVVHAPANSIQRVMMSPADFDDIEHRLPFVLTTEDAGQYDLTYVGKQKVDEVDTYVFTVRPKVIEKGKRYFEGRIWVDQKELQIVVTSGKNVPDDLRKGHEDLSTPFITYRAQIDAKYWFPVYSHGDGVLHFSAGKGYLGEDVHIRQTIKYTDYKKFGTSIRITYAGQDQVAPDNSPAPPAPPQKPQ